MTPKFSDEKVESFFQKIRTVWLVFYTLIALPVAITGQLARESATGDTFSRLSLIVILIFPFVLGTKNGRNLIKK